MGEPLHHTGEIDVLDGLGCKYSFFAIAAADAIERRRYSALQCAKKRFRESERVFFRK